MRLVDAFHAWALPAAMTSPTARGLLAEYLVRRAVGETTQPAEDWHYVDIECKNGLTIEVKCSAYLQPRKDNTLVKIRSPKFSISQKKGAWCNREWNWKPPPESPKRWADIYVLCLECETDPERYAPLDLSQWEFFVIATAEIDRTFKNQDSVTVGRLRTEGFQPVAYDKIKATIDNL